MPMSNPRSNKKIIFLLAVFILPMIISTLLFTFHGYFQFKTTNHGVLVKQPIDVNYFSETKLKKWQILYIDNGTCDAVCEKISYQLHQVQKALGKDGERVHVVLMSDSYPLVKNLKADFEKQSKNNFAVGDKIYLVDPLGNLFMYYSDSTDPMNVLKDMKKVLEVSQIG